MSNSKITQYFYYSESGKKVVLEKHEFPNSKKTFKWKTIVGGNVIYQKGSELLLPYKYNEWKDLDLSRPMFFVESEKSVDDIFSKGGIATTISGGATSNVKKHLKFFKDKLVYILPDNDEPGQKFAQENLELLSTVCKHVKIVNLGFSKSLEDKGKDVFDWFRLGPKNTLEFLNNLSIKASGKSEAVKSLPSKKHKSYSLVEEFEKCSIYKNLCYAKAYWEYKDDHWKICERDRVSKCLFELIKQDEYFMQSSPKDLVRNAELILANSLAELRDEDMDLIPFKSNLISKKDLISSNIKSKIKHGKANTNQYVLPFDYDPDAKSELWNKTLKEILPDLEIRNLLQEIFGYILLGDNDLERFFLCLGEGGNGKGVVTLVLSMLIGKNNCSYLNIDEFASGKSFGLFQIIGKRLNITNEISEVSKTSCESIKALVSGEEMISNKKYQDPIVFMPKVKVWVCSNIFPKFLDKSNGIWRRLLVIPFEQSFDKSNNKKNVNLKNPDYWIKNGNLPGIFNWALEGYRRLIERKDFFVPEACKEFKNEYRNSLNPVRIYLSESVYFDGASEIPSSMLYEDYCLFTHKNGYRKLAKNNFTKEVRSFYNNRVFTTEPKMNKHQKRERFYVGMRFKDNV